MQGRRKYFDGFDESSVRDQHSDIKIDVSSKITNSMQRLLNPPGSGYRSENRWFNGGITRFDGRPRSKAPRFPPTKWHI